MTSTLIDRLRIVNLQFRVKWYYAQWIGRLLWYHYKAMQTEQMEQPRPRLLQWRTHAMQIKTSWDDHRAWKRRMQAMTPDERRAEVHHLENERAKQIARFESDSRSQFGSDSKPPKY